MLVGSTVVVVGAFWQYCPVKPLTHVHEAFPTTPDLQLPPLRHGHEDDVDCVVDVVLDTVMFVGTVMLVG